MSKSKKTQRPHPLVHDRLETRRHLMPRRERRDGTVEQPMPPKMVVPIEAEAPPELLVVEPKPQPEPPPETEAEATPADSVPEAVPEVQMEALETPEADENANAPEPANAPTDVVPEVQAEQVAEAPAEQPAMEAQSPATVEAAEKPAKKAKTKKADGPKKMTAINAAAQVLAVAGKPMSCNELIEEMSKQGLWTSPGGATPAATLYSAILTELKKGAVSRFEKVERGKFAAKAP